MPGSEYFPLRDVYGWRGKGLSEGEGYKAMSSSFFFKPFKKSLGHRMTEPPPHLFSKSEGAPRFKELDHWQK